MEERMERLEAIYLRHNEWEVRCHPSGRVIYVSATTPEQAIRRAQLKLAELKREQQLYYQDSKP
jgi:hypothetical protein